METTTTYYNGELAESFLRVYNLMGIRYVLIALIDAFYSSYYYCYCYCCCYCIASYFVVVVITMMVLMLVVKWLYRFFVFWCKLRYSIIIN